MASSFERKFRMLVVGALAISALAASPALAGGTTTTYKCVVSPNPVTSLLPLYTVSGSGFPAGMVVNVYIKDRIATWIVQGNSINGGVVATNGTFSIANLNGSVFYPSDLGTKTVSVTNATDRRQTTLAQCTFSVK